MGCQIFANGNGTWPSRLPFSPQTSVPLTILVGILIFLTVLGNVLVVMAVITSRALRAPQHLFLVSLACADILVATSVMPFSLANELMGHWYFGKIWCEIYQALDVLFCTSSIVHLCAISLDRYWSVTRAVEHNLKRTPRRIKCQVLVVWVLAAIISFPPLITMTKEEGEEDRPTCRINEERWYIIFSSIASFFAPCVIMITVYARIYQIAVKRTRNPPGEPPRGDRKTDDLDLAGRGDGDGQVDGEDGEEECSSSDENESTLCSPRKKKKEGARNARAATAEARRGETASRRGRRLHRERRFTFVLAVVMGVFVLCWSPFFFTYTLTALCDSCCVPETLFKMFFWLGYCNSSLNPIIYTVFNRDFRRAFRRILCKLDRRAL